MIRKFTNPSYRLFNLLALAGIIFINFYNQHFIFALFYLPALLFHAVLYAKLSTVSFNADFYSSNTKLYNIAILLLLTSLFIQMFQNDRSIHDISIVYFFNAIKYLLLLTSVVLYGKLFYTILKY